MAQATYRSLDRTGTQAAVYPSEEVLWAQGPQINDPGSQGVAGPDSDALEGVGYYSGAGQITLAQEDALLHEQLNGETPNGAYGEHWVNTQVYGPTGYGPYNDQTIFQSGHSQNVVSDPSSEQGWGVGPARRWAHYPHEENVNPFRNRMVHCRNGELPWVVATSSLYERSQLAWEQQFAPMKFRSPLAPVVPVAQSVPFVQTVPTYAGGPAPHPGVDVPIGDEGMYG